uniref:Uncharacterized protein n=1 Tax=Rhizophora mucronata TaxID=61149 RepID=A0A2P2PK04_RHIMU
MFFFPSFKSTTIGEGPIFLFFRLNIFNHYVLGI